MRIDKKQHTHTHLAEQLKGADDVPLVFRARLEHIEHGSPGFDVRLGNLVSGSEGGGHVEVDAVMDRERGERLSGADFLEEIREEEHAERGRGRKGVRTTGGLMPLTAVQRKEHGACVVHLLACSSDLQLELGDAHPRWYSRQIDRMANGPLLEEI